jgi:hypothetical protein
MGVKLKSEFRGAALLALRNTLYKFEEYDGSHPIHLEGDMAIVTYIGDKVPTIYDHRQGIKEWMSYTIFPSTLSWHVNWMDKLPSFAGFEKVPQEWVIDMLDDMSTTYLNW